MQTMRTRDMRQRSEVLADALRETIAELRLIDAGDMITYIRAGQWANIADLVQSSAELSFEDGAISFADSGDYAMNWGEAPTVALNMEFQTRDLTAFFTLTLGSRDSSICVNEVLFAVAQPDQASATRLFADALADARRAARVGRGDRDDP